jgi:hypothetical protein
MPNRHNRFEEPDLSAAEACGWARERDEALRMELAHWPEPPLAKAFSLGVRSARGDAGAAREALMRGGLLSMPAAKALAERAQNAAERDELDPGEAAWGEPRGGLRELRDAQEWAAWLQEAFAHGFESECRLTARASARSAASLDLAQGLAQSARALFALPGWARKPELRAACAESALAVAVARESEPLAREALEAGAQGDGGLDWPMPGGGLERLGWAEIAALRAMEAASGAQSERAAGAMRIARAIAERGHGPREKALWTIALGFWASEGAVVGPLSAKDGEARAKNARTALERLTPALDEALGFAGARDLAPAAPDLARKAAKLSVFWPSEWLARLVSGAPDADWAWLRESALARARSLHFNEKSNPVADKCWRTLADFALSFQKQEPQMWSEASGEWGERLLREVASAEARQIEAQAQSAAARKSASAKRL